MKNFLKIKPDDWKRERKIGQVSFILKRAVIFAIILTPLNLLVNFLLLSENEKFRPGAYIFRAIIMSVGFSVGEWAILEYEYRKNMRKENLAGSKDYGEKEK